MINLSENSKLYTEISKVSYRICSGTARVFLVPLSGEKGLRRMYLLSAGSGTVIPSLCSTFSVNQKNTLFQLLIIADSPLVLEQIPREDQHIRDFLDKTGIPYDSTASSNDLFTDALLYRYAQIRSEENRIVKRLSQKRLVNRSKAARKVAGIFSTSDYLKFASDSDTDFPLYNAMAFLCRMRKIRIAPLDRVQESCGDDFTVSDIARLSGFLCREVKLTRSWTLYDTEPVLIFRSDDQVPVVAFRHKGNITYWDPETAQLGSLKKIVSDFSTCSAYALSKPLPGKINGFQDIIHFTLSDFNVWDFVSLFVSTLLASSAGILVTKLNEILFDSVVPSGETEILFSLCLTLIFCMIGSLMFSISKSVAGFRLSSRARYSLQAALYDRLFHMPSSFFRNKDCGSVSYRIDNLPNIYISCFSSIIEIFTSSVFSLVYFTQMSIYSQRLSFFSLFFVFLNVTLTIIIGLKYKNYQSQRGFITGKIRSFLFQTFGGINSIRTNGVENEFFLRYLDNLSEYSKSDLKISRGQRLSSVVSSASIFGALTFFFFEMSNYRLSLSTGQFIAFLSIFSAFSSSAGDIAQNILKLIIMQPVLKNSSDVLNEVPESASSGIVVPNLEGKITVSNLSFSYGKPSEAVLKHINLQVKPGEYVAIVGPSGCGKSTLLKLLLGFERPSDGKIYYDDIDLDRINKTELRRKIGTVLQDGVLFNGSIYKNIAISCPNVSDQEIFSAADAADLTDDIAAMPLGFNTLVSEQTHTISTGQKQRIMIARAIVGKPDIIFMDEATSSLDNISQAKIRNNLADLHATRIVIAHRLSTVADCDRIYVMDNGSIVEEGSYQELMEKKGLFYQLAQRQILSENSETP